MCPSVLRWLTGLLVLHRFCCEHYVVQLSLSEQRPAAELETPGGVQGQDEEAAQRIDMSIGGRPFQCQLPSPRAVGPHQAKKAAQYLALSKAAALHGTCLQGRAEETGEEFELCVGEQFSAAGMSAPRDGESDSLLRGGGFLQIYSNVAPAGRNLRAMVRCQCELPEEPHSEPPCRRGDMVRLEGLQDVVAVVADDRVKGDGQLLGVRWTNGSAGGLYVEGSRAIAENGQPCLNPMPPRPPVARLVRASCKADPTAGAREFKIEMASVLCCNQQVLRRPAATSLAVEPPDPERRPQGGPPQPELEFTRLLAPLAGRCMHVVSGWWTYEVCYPWRVRQLHSSVNGDVEAPAIVLGHFGATAPSLRKAAASDAAASRADGRRQELVLVLEGESCEKTVHTWELALESSLWTGGGGHQSVSAVGGSFNPTWNQPELVEGQLANVEANVDGCVPFSERLDGRILLVRRGKCWFHTKALHAQAAGAVALVVYNDQRHMVDVMEGVDDLPSPRIPTVLIERENGHELLKMVGTSATLSKVDWDGVDLTRPMSTTVIFHCSPEWDERQEACRPGDVVDVKLVSEDQAESEPRFPKATVRVLRATVMEVYKHNSSLRVSWQLQGLGEEEEAELPAVVLSNYSYNGGLRCDGEVSAYIERLAEPQACQAEFVVHAASLCAHAKLAPPPVREAQPINCVASSNGEGPPSSQPPPEPVTRVGE